MWRIVILMIVGGGVLCFFGYREYSVSAGASSEPLDVELSDIENGKIPDTNHIRLGPHYRLYYAAVYKYEARNKSNRLSEYTKVSRVYYPVYSMSSPFGKQMSLLMEKHGGIPEDLPDSEHLPNGGLSMIIKTNKYQRIGGLPKGVVASDGIDGLVINTIESIGSEEKKLLQMVFGKIDFSKVLVLQQDRKPTSTAVYMAMMGGGVLLMVAPLFVGLAVSRREPEVRAKFRSLTGSPAAGPPDLVAPPTQPSPTDGEGNP